ncbi:hypothetical protein Q9L58_008759 [Maublancomyces gigas]|uniref:N-acetyltransferase domain-containing protein n=1 Tax=Discina gigas TaxID=1032678 RepID=A0ABR3G8T9_9PEZI
MVLEPKSLSLISAKERIYVRGLTLKDLDACVSLENQTFIPEERCSRKQFKYRLSTCPELSLGIFTASSFPNPYTGLATEVLLGHAIATKTSSRLVTDACMASSPYSHTESGTTVALHSLAILPSYQRRTLGTTLLAEFIRRSGSRPGIPIERIAIIARERLVRFYQRFGFTVAGASGVGFGGGGWRDLVLEFGDEKVYSYGSIASNPRSFMKSLRSAPMISDH